MLVMNTKDHDCRCAPICTQPGSSGDEATHELITPMPGLKCVKNSRLAQKVVGAKWKMEFCSESDLEEKKHGIYTITDTPSVQQVNDTYSWRGPHESVLHAEIGNSYNCIRSHSDIDEQKTRFHSAIKTAFGMDVGDDHVATENVFAN